jgi:AraC-like DNA-binding protein
MTKVYVQVNEKSGDPAERWADLVCAHLVLAECQSIPDPAHFSAQIELNALTGLRVARVSGKAQKISRTQKHLAAASDEYFLLNIQRHGTGLVRQGGREVLLKPGEMALYSSHQPYQLEFTAPFEQKVLIVPAERLRQQLPKVDQLLVGAIDPAALSARLLSVHIDGLLALDTGPENGKEMIEQATLTMLVDALHSAQHNAQENGLCAYHMQRINRLLAHNLGNSDFGVYELASSLGLSEGYLNRLFQSKTGESPNKWLVERRLLLSQLALSSPTCLSMSITEIAYSWGFGSYAHFSRAFHKRFGLAPSEWRNNQLG